LPTRGVFSYILPNKYQSSFCTSSNRGLNFFGSVAISPRFRMSLRAHPDSSAYYAGRPVYCGNAAQ
jgi:hypothetical protein